MPMDCRAALVHEIPHQLPGYDRYHDARVELSYLGQNQVYLPFMGRQILDQFQSGVPDSYVASWDEGDPAHFFNAYFGVDLVGVTDLQTQRDNWRLVEPMYVLPECQRQGIGRKLWEACRVAARADGARGLRVVALKQNEMANQFYSVALGLPQVGTETLTIGSHSFPAVRYEIAFG
jgi:GNAT superfamily N-acetyltransferase